MISIFLNDHFYKSIVNFGWFAKVFTLVKNMLFQDQCNQNYLSKMLEPVGIFGKELKHKDIPEVSNFFNFC